MEKASLEQLLAVQTESRDGDKTVLWIQNLFLIRLCKALADQIGFKFNFEEVMTETSDYVSENFEALSKEEQELFDFRKIVDMDDKSKNGGR
jgi:hypothetical protein